MWLRNDTSNGPFGPPHSPRFIYGLGAELAKVVTELLDAFEGKDQVDIVGTFYTLPVGPSAELLASAVSRRWKVRSA
ncbi:hypothetical protein ACWET9_41650 [Streptomyces sp. NPDC004059]